MKYKYTMKQSEELEKTRDYFAGLAMQYYFGWYDDMPKTEKDKNLIAKFCYDFADAMIKEKLKRQNICNKDETQKEHWYESNKDTDSHEENW